MTLVPAIDTLAGSVHELGRKASAPEGSADRAIVYGELMATCAACHDRLGGGTPAARQR